MDWRQGALLEVTVGDLAPGGDGVARWENRVIFIPNSAPGDRVQVRLVRVKEREAYGHIEALLVAGENRVRPRCIVADKCGGCQWQFVDYGRQAQAKLEHVRQALGVQASILPVLAATEPFHYRNKVTYPLAYTSSGEVGAGYYRQGSHRMVNINQCPIQDPQFDTLLPVLKESLGKQGWSLYNEETGVGLLRHLGFRIGRRTGEVLITLVATAEPPGLERWAQQVMGQFPAVVGVGWNLNDRPGNTIFGPETRTVTGRGYVREIFCGLEFQIGATTFFQVNTEQAERLVQLVVQAAQLTGEQTVVDAYCGIGTLSLPLAQRAKSVIGIECWGDSVQQARANAHRNGLNNCSFQLRAVEEWLPRQKMAPDVLCLDPPRKGCDRAVLQALLKHPVQRLIYVSCNPSTLGRDVRVLTQGGYALVYVQPVDFFPQTYHVECLAVLDFKRPPPG
ncbi:23S rRNA (uracil(1939)-C(5))-methyltransferase RlmD [Anthocerotibacter panamensis]|uniref:23S rRNA (uracil(1939)-C(5))-methyltransferase RlmD n=1 Tax=Anthocerotibacter panamensis TaxID=2857077 RepID=UPI001C405460|nr:23S rRNA (uracil(1939)-C(5))-methyltransferase RlmD [Anthocerotibacter panamensis]